MKIPFILLGVSLIVSQPLCAQPQKIYSISSGPGEDASRQIGISWAADTAASPTYLVYTVASDANWKHAIKSKPQQCQLWTAFDGVRSSTMTEEDFRETARFIKCGVMLDGLKPDTEYKYYIKETRGEQSREGRFKTAGAEEWSCCVISDFHGYPPLPGRNGHGMMMIDVVREVDPSVDWVFSAGDVVTWGGSYSFWKRFFQEKNTAELMWARANGNHDNWTKESQETHDFDIPNDYFLGTSYYPRNGYEGEMGVCYHFRYGNTLFIMLNTEDMKKPGEFEAAADWVRNVVRKEKAGENPPAFTVACMHYEWFLGTNGRTSEYGRWHKVFDEVGVDLAVAGNNHIYLRSHILFDDKLSEDGRGTLYLQTPASDNERGRIISDKEFFNSDKIVTRWSEGRNTMGAVLMKMDGNHMSLQLLDRKGKVVDSTALDAK